MLDAHEIAAALLTSRDEFATLFLQAQFHKGIPAADRNEFEAVATSIADDREAFQRALTYARDSGFLNELVSLIVNKGFDGGVLQKRIAEMTGDPHLLQAITDPERGFDSPSKTIFGMKLGMDCTGKVLINKQFKGSGVLIEPDKFLTSWHVVRDMFEPTYVDGKTVFTPKPNTEGWLEVVLGDALDYNGSYSTGRSTTVAAMAGEDWCPSFCACHPLEYSSTTIPDDLTEFDTYWDYAVIRLQRATDRMPARILRGAVVPEGDRIYIFQHPKGLPMQVDSDVVHRCQPPRHGIPQIRFLHRVNTLDGSSGAPCFDNDYTLVGIHQGKWGTLRIDNADQVMNRGIAIRSITKHLGTVRRTPFISTLDKRNFLPVIGCDGFQEILADAAARSTNGGDLPGVLLIDGPKGSGKTFQVRVLQAFLNNQEHVKIVLAGETIATMNAVALAMHLSGQAGADAGAGIRPLEEYHSTPGAWLKDEVLRYVLDALEAKRCGRMVWICLTDLNLFELSDPQTSDLLLLLYSQVQELPWLRIVLDGVRTDLPAAVVPPERVHRYTVPDITLPDIRNFMQRFFEDLQLPKEALAQKDAFAQVLHLQYDMARQRTPEGRMAFLSEAARSLLAQFLTQLNG